VHVRVRLRHGEADTDAGLEVGEDPAWIQLGLAG
jgi:hypothetical protein